MSGNGAAVIVGLNHHPRMNLLPMIAAQPGGPGTMLRPMLPPGTFPTGQPGTTQVPMLRLPTGGLIPMVQSVGQAPGALGMHPPGMQQGGPPVSGAPIQIGIPMSPRMPHPFMQQPPPSDVHPGP